MNLKQALSIILDLASDNVLDERDAMDERQREEARKQEEAVEVVGDYLNSIKS